MDGYSRERKKKSQWNKWKWKVSVLGRSQYLLIKVP
jgi:hypothetical protein